MIESSCASTASGAWHKRLATTQVLELERENLRLNGVAGRVCTLDWRDRNAAIRLGTFELILCADLLYASAIVKVLCVFPVQFT